jgi:peptidoglycan/xylan/chitin deacetylase (PgdA/CDA1 family)
VSRRPQLPTDAGLAGRLPILMYHSLPDGPAGNDLQVPLREFTTHVQVLRDHGFQVLGLTRGIAAVGAGHGSGDLAPRVVAITVDDGYLDVLPAAEALAEHRCAATLYVSTARMGGAGTVPGAGRLLDWSELAALHTGFAPSVEIGSHAHDHRPLDVLDAGAVAEQARLSADRLAEHTGARPASFCYPHGYAAAATVRAVRAAGYTNACIVGRRVARAGDDLFALPRLQVRPGTGPRALLELLYRGEGGWRPQAKRLAGPGWRQVRRVSLRLGRELT